MYTKVMQCSVDCRTSEEAASLARLANLFRSAHDVVSTPTKGMAYEDRCLLTAKRERIVSDIQRSMNIRVDFDRHEVANMYERVANAIKKYKSRRPDTSEWYEAFVEALDASIAVARFENQEDRADTYRQVIPSYKLLRDLCIERSKHEPGSADWHDYMASMHAAKTMIAEIQGDDNHVRSSESRESLHRDASMAVRLNSSLRPGSLAWFANAEKLHHVVHRLETDPESIATETFED